MKSLGSIQEDRHKSTKWNSSTFYGTVPLFGEKFHNLWNNVQKCGKGPVSGSQFHKLWNKGPDLNILKFLGIPYSSENIS